MNTGTPMYENILRNVASGVIALDSNGLVIAFNPAAEALLGVRAGDVVGRTMTDALIAIDGLDKLTDAILDAVYGKSVSDQRIVSVSHHGAWKSRKST